MFALLSIPAAFESSSLESTRSKHCTMHHRLRTQFVCSKCFRWGVLRKFPNSFDRLFILFVISTLFCVSCFHLRNFLVWSMQAPTKSNMDAETSSRRCNVGIEMGIDFHYRKEGDRSAWYCLKENCFSHFVLEKSIIAHLVAEHGMWQPEVPEVEDGPVRMLSNDPRNVRRRKTKVAGLSEGFDRTRRTLRARWKKLKSQKWLQVCEDGILHHRASYLERDFPLPRLHPTLLARLLLVLYPPCEGSSLYYSFLNSETEWVEMKKLLVSSIKGRGIVPGWCNDAESMIKAINSDPEEKPFHSTTTLDMYAVVVKALREIFDPSMGDTLRALKQQMVTETVTYFQRVLDANEFEEEKSIEARDRRIREHYRQWKLKQFPESKRTICGNLKAHYMAKELLNEEEAAIEVMCGSEI